MKKLLILTVVFASAISLIGCGGAKGDNPGYAYMPDMYYSRAYEAYGYNNQDEDHDLQSRGAFFNGKPVLGTVARGDAYTFPLPPGDSGYARAAAYPSPLPSMKLTGAQLKEAERLYLINCGICHGTSLNGNGPLWNDGNGPYPAAPRNLLDDHTKALSDGQIYHVITYGKGQMGSYASQVKPEQRWWITNYIRQKQGGSAAGTAATAATGAATETAATTDTTKTTN